MADVAEIRPAPARSPAFEIGAIVKLRSGSPPLIVSAVLPGARGAPARVTCDWFDEAAWDQAVFPAACLCEPEAAK